MAFTEAQTVKITRITGIRSNWLEEILAANASYITAEVESQVGDLILEWFPASGTAAGRDFTNIHPMERNFGAEIRPGERRNAIRREIADLLYLTEYMTLGSPRLVRA